MCVDWESGRRKERRTGSAGILGLDHCYNGIAINRWQLCLEWQEGGLRYSLILLVNGQTSSFSAFPTTAIYVRYSDEKLFFTIAPI